MDPLFPLPDPGPLLVYHDVLTIWPMTAFSSDSEGRPVVDSSASVVVSECYVSWPDRREFPAGGTEMESVDVVVLVRNGTAVAHDDEMTVAGVGNGLDGRYEITGVRPNASHTRVLGRRVAEVPR